MVFETLIDFRCLSKLDTKCLDSLKDYSTVITLEDGITDGGFDRKSPHILALQKQMFMYLGLRKNSLTDINPLKC